MDYPFTVYGHLTETSTGQIIYPLVLFRKNGCIGYKFFMGQVTLIYYVSSNGIPSYVKACAPNPSGKMVIFVVDEEVDQTLFRDDFVKPMLKRGVRF